MRRVLVLASLALALLAAEPAAAARNDVPKDLDAVVTTTNVMVHYRTGVTTETTARTVAEGVETALAKYLELGFPRPQADDDGLIDVYMFAFAASVDADGVSSGDDKDSPTTSGYIKLDTNQDRPEGVVKHELFHLVEFTIGRGRSPWLGEALANWGQNQAEPTRPTSFRYFTRPDYQVPLDCDDTVGICEGYTEGYSSWVFFSRLDAQLIQDTLVGIGARFQADGLKHGLDVLLPEMAERGLTLAGVLSDLGTRAVQETLGYANSETVLPETDLSITPPATGAASAPSTDVVHHASLGFTRVVPAGSDCTTVPLALDLQGPEGVAVASFVQRGGAAQPLTPGVTTVPWIACKANPAMVVVANGTLDADEQSFTVTGRAVAPVLSGLKVAAKTTRRAGRGFRLPVSVQSSAVGTLRAALAGGPSKVVALKPGANAFALQVPKRFRAAKAALTLTPSVGGYRGKAVRKSLKFKTKRR